MILKINTRTWTTVAQLALELGISKQAVCNQIARGTRDTWRVKALDITLVKR